MKLTAFRIENFRSIQDSGWVNVDDIAVIVGKNESGKTSLLKALWKFKPFKDVKYDLDREWPRGRRKDKSPDKVVATVRFEFSPEEIQLVESIHASARGVSQLQQGARGETYHGGTPKEKAGRLVSGHCG